MSQHDVATDLGDGLAVGLQPRRWDRLCRLEPRLIVAEQRFVTELRAGTTPSTAQMRAWWGVIPTASPVHTFPRRRIIFRRWYAILTAFYARQRAEREVA